MQGDQHTNTIKRIRTYREDAALAQHKTATIATVTPTQSKPATPDVSTEEQIERILASAPKDSSNIIQNKATVVPQQVPPTPQASVPLTKLAIDPTLSSNIKKIRTFKDAVPAAKTSETTTISSNVSVTAHTPQVTVQQTKETTLDTKQLYTPTITTSQQQKIVVNTSPIHTVQKQQQIQPLPKKFSVADVETIAIPQKASILSDNDPNEEQSLDGGKIISDRKRARFRLLPALYTALTQYISETVHTLNQKEERPMVTKVEERIDVLKKAAQQSTRTPREDFSVVAQTLKQVERKPVATSINIIEKTQVPVATWSHTTDTPTTQTEVSEVAAAPVATPITPTPEYVSQTTSVPTVPAVTAKQAVVQKLIDNSLPVRKQETIAPVTQTKVSEVAAAPVATPITPTPEYISQTTSVPVAPQRAYIQTPQRIEEATEAAYIKPLPSTVPQNRRVFTQAPARNATAWLPSLALIGVIFFATVSGVATTYYFFKLRTTPTSPAVVANIPTHVKAQTSVPYTLPQTRSELFTAIISLTQSTQGITQTYGTIRTNDGRVSNATAQQILSTARFNISDTFTRSIKSITFGSVDGTYQFVVITATDFDTLFAGMLNWEKAMPLDLSLLNAQKAISGSTFKDTVAYNKNIRVLVNENGEDLLVYAFVNQQTVVIVPNRTLLQTLVPIIQ